MRLVRDDALSEVIGFILIIAVLAILATLYITYVVPAEGRDGEILHMNEIQSQFYDLKAGIDSLWLNNQVNNGVTQTFTLGTKGASASSGGFYIFPLFSPIGSFGTMQITPRDDWIQIEADALQTATFNGTQASSSGPIIERPYHIYLTFNTFNNQVEDLIQITPSPNLGYWKIDVRTTRNCHYNYSNPAYCQPATDLTLTVEKNNQIVFQNLVVRRNIQNFTDYTIDISDDAFGVSGAFQYPFSIPENYIGAQGSLTGRYNPSYGYSQWSLTPLTRLSSIDFYSDNNYWIQQHYYYQMGGVFLEQQDGLVAKIPPLITVTNDNGVARVEVVEVLINGEGNIAGASAVQVFSQLTSYAPGANLAEGIPNARWANITIYTDQKHVGLWRNTFEALKLRFSNEPYNVPAGWIDVSNTASSCTMTIRGPVNSTTYDLALSIMNVDISSSIQRTGTILQ